MGLTLPENPAYFPQMNDLPAIPDKSYFSIGEVGELCAVKPHVLRYWEQEFEQLKPVKRRGNRRYYQRHEVQMVRRIRELLYDQGYTIQGARSQLLEHAKTAAIDLPAPQSSPIQLNCSSSLEELRQELLNIQQLLKLQG